MLASARFLVLLLSTSFFIASAQQVPIARVTRPITESERVTLPQKPHHLARLEFDRGPAPATLPMNRMMLILKRSPEQETQLKTLLDSQLRASSPQYREWLTPEQFGAQFGPSDQDLKTITTWLQSHGFAVQPAAKGKAAIEFSGNAQQVSEAFHTAIHRFVVNGKEHWANTASPSIPTALTPVIAGITTLNSFHLESRKPRPARSPKPFLTNSDGAHALSPEDYATIYNINPLYQATPVIDGTGSTIAVVGVDFVDPDDISDFRSTFKLKAFTPQILYPYGQVDDSDSGSEGTLDVSWSGAIAPGAAINYVAIPDTFADEGLFLSELYIVDNNLGDIVSESFGVCEAFSDPAFNTFIESVREQAAAQGMTYIVSAGDNGPYGCDDFDTELTVADPTLVSVNLLAASPYVTAVGGTMFNDTADPTKFWGPPTRLPSQATAKSYIPEIVWEQSCDSQFCFMNIVAGSGGQSSVYPKPSWQSGVTGIQQDSTRDLPDVALAASGVDPYLICIYGGCEGGDLEEVSGTSASAPSFAGMMALVRQKVGSRLGAINPKLYALAAAQNYANCNGSLDTVAATCVFNDISMGSNGVNGEPNFDTSTAIYQAAVGYDLATGLGSVNATNLANSWNISGEHATTTTLAISPATFVHGATANMTISVAPANGTGVPTGPVDLTSTTVSFGSFLLASGNAQSSMPPLAGGTYSVSALYGGDGTFAASTSNAVPVIVTPEPSTTIGQADTPCDTAPLCQVSIADYGSTVTLSAQVLGTSTVGAPSGTVTFTDSTSATGSGSLLLNNDGSSGYETNSLTVGAHTFKMTYPGDASFLPSASVPFTLTIQPAATFVFVTPDSFCGLPNTPFPLTVFVASLYDGVEEGTLTVAGNTPGITAPASFITNLTIPSLPLGLNTITVNYSGDANYMASSGSVAVNISAGTCFASMVNGADYQAGVAPQEIVSIFGNDLAAATTAVTGSTLPQTLGGTSVTFKDPNGVTSTADLFFVSSTQINAAVPKGLASGSYTAQVTTATGTSQFPIVVSPISPALFTADGSGNGLASAEIVRDHQGTLTTTVVTSTPIAFNGDNLFLVLFGTGSANVTPSDVVQVMFNGEITTPSYIGAQGQYEGLDQINVPLPYSLAGAGSVDIQVVIDGISSNTVTVPFQ